MTTALLDQFTTAALGPVSINLCRCNVGCGVKMRNTPSEQMFFAVGTRVTSRPPHRSVRAQFGHTAPTLGV